MFKRIDHSPLLSRFIAFFSDFASKRRGLPIVIGIIFALVGFILQLVEFFAPSPALRLIGLIAQNLGTITALIGLLLSDALGK
jgi:hypothetical protein